VPFETEESSGPTENVPFSVEASLPFHTSSHEADVVGELLDEGADEDSGSVDVSLDDTNPRIRVPSAHAYHEDTQPRAIIEGVLLRDEEKDEISQSGKSRPGVGRVTRRRGGTSSGSPAVSARSTASSPKLAAVKDEEPNDSSIPTQPGVNNRRASQPQGSKSPLKWIGLLLGLLVAGGGVGAFLFFMLNRPPEPEVKPPPARPLFPPGTKASRVPAPGAPVPEVSPARDSAQAEEKPADVAPAEPRAEAPSVAEAPAVETDPAAEVAAPAQGATMEEKAPMADATAAEAAVPTEETTPVAETAPAPVDSESDGLSDDALLAPLRPTTASTASSSTKRGVVRNKRTPTPSRSQSPLQKEWTRTKGAFKALTKTVGCEQLALLCKRYDYLEGQLRAGSEEEAVLLTKVKELYRDIQLKAKGGS
jgi:hypothetical protein